MKNGGLTTFLVLVFFNQTVLGGMNRPFVANRKQSLVQEIKNANEFNAALANNQVVLAEFYSPTCPHCINFERLGILESVAKEMPHVYCIKVSSDLIEVHRKAGIDSYPSLVTYKNGKKVGTRKSILYREKLKEFVNESTNG